MYIIIEIVSYIRVNIDAFFSKCAFWKEGTIFLGMYVWAFFIGIIAIRPVSALNLFLVILLITFLLLLF